MFNQLLNSYILKTLKRLSQSTNKLFRYHQIHNKLMIWAHHGEFATKGTSQKTFSFRTEKIEAHQAPINRLTTPLVKFKFHSKTTQTLICRTATDRFLHDVICTFFLEYPVANKDIQRLEYTHTANKTTASSTYNRNNQPPGGLFNQLRLASIGRILVHCGWNTNSGRMFRRIII